MKYQVYAYYQQNISFPHSYEAQSFHANKAALGWERAIQTVFLWKFANMANWFFNWCLAQGYARYNPA